jgi:hypothetical protein
MKGNNMENYNTNHKGLATCRKLAGFLDNVKREVFAEYEAELGANEQLLRLAIHEADALARQTGYPHLLLPLLAAEKARTAAQWQFRQQFLLRSNDPLAA